MKNILIIIALLSSTLIYSQKPLTPENEIRIGLDGWGYAQIECDENLTFKITSYIAKRETPENTIYFSHSDIAELRIIISKATEIYHQVKLFQTEFEKSLGFINGVEYVFRKFKYHFDVELRYLECNYSIHDFRNKNDAFYQKVRYGTSFNILNAYDNYCEELEQHKINYKKYELRREKELEIISKL